MLPKSVNTEVKNKCFVPCGCDYLQIQSKEPTTCYMEIVNVWINVSHNLNYLLNIELSLIVMSIPPISTLSKEIRKTMNKIKDDLKTVEEVWDTNSLYMDIPISKRGITRKPLWQTSQNKCHAHSIFISIMYSNFHVDVVLDWKRQRRRCVTCFRDVAVVLEQSQDFQNFT